MDFTAGRRPFEKFLQQNIRRPFLFWNRTSTCLRSSALEVCLRKL